MRLHFEQVRLASMIEHKSMEAQLRKLSKRLNKVLVRKQRLDDRDNASCPQPTWAAVVPSPHSQ